MGLVKYVIKLKKIRIVVVESFHTVYFLLDVSNYVIYEAKLGAAS